MSTAPARFRAHPRRQVRLSVIVWHPRAGWQREAEVHNISLGGACLALNEAMGEGDRITLSFVTPTLWDPLAMPSRVVWVRHATRLEPATAGVQFEPNDASAVFALFEMIGALDYSE